MKKGIKFLKIIKLFSFILIIFIVIYSLSFYFARYGWELFGYRFCHSPKSLFAWDVDVDDNSVSLKGCVSDSAFTYNDYIYKAINDNLYIGLKYNMFFCKPDTSGPFDIVIDYDMTKINNIYFKNADFESIIWKRSNSEKLQSIKSIHIYETIHISQEPFSQEELLQQIKNVEPKELDKELVSKFTQAIINEEIVFWKGDYLGIATLKNGEKLYLKISDYGNFFSIIGEDYWYRINDL